MSLVVGKHNEPQSLKPVNKLHGKSGFADKVKLRILRWEDYTGGSGWAQCNLKGSCERRQGSQRRCGIRGRGKRERVVLLSLKMEEDVRSQGMEKEMAIHSSIVS